MVLLEPEGCRQNLPLPVAFFCIELDEPMEPFDIDDCALATATPAINAAAAINVAATFMRILRGVWPQTRRRSGNGKQAGLFHEACRTFVLPSDVKQQNH
jgi:hypothetical protein